VSVRVPVTTLPDQSPFVQYRSIKFNRDQSSLLLKELNGSIEASIGCRFDSRSGEWLFLFMAENHQSISDLTHVLQHVESVASRVKQSEIERSAHSLLTSSTRDRGERLDREPRMERERFGLDQVSGIMQVSPKDQASPLSTPELSNHSSSPMSASPELQPASSSKRDRVDDRGMGLEDSSESLKKRRTEVEGMTI